MQELQRPLPAPVEDTSVRSCRLLPLFVYGSLLDEQLLTNLLEHRVVGQPATLAGFRVCSLAGLAWPVLVPDPDATVDGHLYQELSFADYRRLDAYEGVGEQLYRRCEVTVATGAVTGAAAFAYLPTTHTLSRYGGAVSNQCSSL